MRRAFILPVTLALAFCLIGSGADGSGNLGRHKDSGIPGYTDDDWRGSATMGSVRYDPGMRAPSEIYSNAYDALWFLGRIRADLLPHKDSPAEIAALLAKGDFYVVWFNDGLNSDLVDIAFISRYKKARRG